MEELNKRRNKIVDNRLRDLANLNNANKAKDTTKIKMYERLVNDETSDINSIDKKLEYLGAMLELTKKELKEKEKRCGMNIKD